MITLHKVLDSEMHVLHNLYSLYLHEMANYTSSLEINEDGMYHYDDKSLLSGKEGVSPYLIKSNHKLAGFLLLLERPFLKNKCDFAVNDLFILNHLKGKGIGMNVLSQLFQQKSGKYFVVQLQQNTPAVSFWKKIYQKEGIQFEERTELIDGEPCLIQIFDV